MGTMNTISLRGQILLFALAATLAATFLLVRESSEASAGVARQTCQDNESSCLSYSGTAWKKVRNDKAMGGTYHVSSSTTRAAFFAAAGGPDIDLVTITGPKMGKARVVVINLVNGDVVKQVTFNLRAANTHYKAVRTITNLGPDIPYGVVVASANGRPVVVDAITHREAPTALPPHVVAGASEPPPPPGSSG